MASPPYATSPSGMSPPNPTPAQLPKKKRSSTLDMNNGPPVKRRKGSTVSQTSVATHPLRQTSFPPEGRSPMPRSPSVDAMSAVSGSAVSGHTAASGAPKKKRGRKSKSVRAAEEAAAAAAAERGTPSLAGGRAPTTASGRGGGGDGDGEGEDDDEDDKAEMAVEGVGARTQEQKQEEIRLRAMLVESFDSEQYNRYELWRAAKLSDAVVKRVVNATVSQSVPQMVSTAVKAVSKLFAGELIELARNVQAEWIAAGEKQSEMPDPSAMTTVISSVGADAGLDMVGMATPPDESEKEEEVDVSRGPLRPDHLREAWRRYRFGGESYGVGVQQLWHAQQASGTERFSTRTGRRLFK